MQNKHLWSLQRPELQRGYTGRGGGEACRKPSGRVSCRVRCRVRGGLWRGRQNAHRLEAWSRGRTVRRAGPGCVTDLGEAGSPLECGVSTLTRKADPAAGGSLACGRAGRKACFPAPGAPSRSAPTLWWFCGGRAEPSSGERPVLSQVEGTDYTLPPGQV